jgi:similar to stage IV sporulation protein
MLLSFILGFARVHISDGDVIRFLNLCKAKNISLWKVDLKENEASFFIRKSQISFLDKPKEKSGVEMKILKKYGLPYIFAGWKKRYMLLIGALICFGLLYIESLFIWDISVSGESNYTSEEIIDYITENYVSYGTKKSSISCEELESSLREKYSSLAWVSCSIKGTRLYISIKESLDVFTDTGLEVPSNIVAVKDAVISDIVTGAGTPVVQSGSEVKKGDILISGAVYLYDDNDELLDTLYVPARGVVMGICEYDYSESFDMEYTSKEYDGELTRHYSFDFFGHYLFSYKEKGKYEYYDVEEEEKKLHIGDFYVPVALVTTTEKSYSPERKEYTEDEAYEKAEARLNNYIGDLKEKGVQILENNVRISIDDGKCIAGGTIKTIEPVGIALEIKPVESDMEQEDLSEDSRIE